MTPGAVAVRRTLPHDISLATALLVLALLTQRMPFLTINGARVLWMAGGLIVGVLSVLPTRRWWPYLAAFVVGVTITLLMNDWPTAALLTRLAFDTAVVALTAAALRRGGWLLMREPGQVWGVAAVGLLAGLARAGGLGTAAAVSDSVTVTNAAQPSLAVLSTMLGLLTAAPFAALMEVDGLRPDPGQRRHGVLWRTVLVAAALVVVLVLSGPVFGDPRIAVMMFVALAYAALSLPATILAALLIVGAGGSVAVAMRYFVVGNEAAGQVTLQSGTAVVLPVVGLTLVCWILYSVGNVERRASRRIAAIMDSLQDPHVLMSPVRDSEGRVVDFRVVDGNEAGAVDHGVTRQQLVGSLLSDLAPSEFQDGMLDRYVAVLETGEPLVLDGFRLHDDSRGRELRAFDLRAVRLADGLVVTWRDVTEREEEAAQLAEREHRYRLLAENAMDLVFFFNAEERLEWVSPSIEPVLGYRPRDLVGRDRRELMHPDDPAPSTETQRVRLQSAAGSFAWFEVTYRPVRDDDGHLVGGVMAGRDVDAEVRASLELEREMSFDSLTGLARRGLAVRRIQETLDRNPGRRWTLMVAGVDRLTLINTAYGFGGGDRVLQAVAERLVNAVGGADRVSRVGGDEFAILLTDVENAAAAAREARRLLDAVRGPVLVGDESVQVTASLGISMAGGQSGEVLLAEATAAMSQASKSGPDRWEFLDGDAGEESRLALTREAFLRTALAEHRIRAWFMPVVDLETGVVRGYEALARCLAPDGSVMPPASFLPSAEASGAVLDLDREMLQMAIGALAVLPAGIHVAANVSGASLAADDFLDLVRSSLLATDVAPSRLHLEVTETTLVRVTASTAQRMSVLADMGTTWWVDDFGTGYSSISHLRDLPIGGLKLDRSFTAGVHDDRGRAARLAEGLAGLANGLGLQTVAEGIEDSLQAEILAAQGWRLGQGYLYGRAVPLESLTMHSGDAGSPT